MRQFYLLAYNCLASRVYKIVRSCYVLWLFFAKNYHPFYSRIGHLHAYCFCSFASKNVPAYREFLTKNNFKFKMLSLECFPETNKENYVKAYGYVERCLYGKLKVIGTSVDESSGSSGVPFNWVRSQEELFDIHKSTANWVNLEFPHKKLFTINAFSMGAWATGINTGIALSKVGMVKSTGPDIAKIIDTIESFGNDFEYLVTGYPPFLKHLCDEMDQRRFPWEKYCIYGMVGGEGMTEALRDYLQRRFRKVRSGYGATDIQIGIAGETDFSVWLRKELIRDPALARRLLGEDEKRIPMVFQYNPLDHFIEVNEQSELVITVNNQSVMSPRLRYNVKDEGKILDFSAAMDILRSGGRDDRQFSAKYKDFLKIPLLFLFGRKDSTISYMGANIYPQDIEYGLYKNAEHAGLIESFCLSLEEQSNLECRPVIYVELRKDAKLDGHRKDEMVDSIRKGMVEHLAQVSRDFAQSLKEDQTTAEIHIRLCEFGTGIFKDKGNRIKNVYLIKGKTL